MSRKQRGKRRPCKACKGTGREAVDLPKEWSMGMHGVTITACQPCHVCRPEKLDPYVGTGLFKPIVG